MISLKSLRKYQIFGVKYLLQNTHAGFWLGMGLGKTVTALTVLSILIKKDSKVKPLILAPLRTAKYTWKQEAEMWEHLTHLKISLVVGDVQQRIAALKADADIWVMNHDNVIWLVKLLKRRKFFFNVLIIDESSRYKNHEAKSFYALKVVWDKFRRVVLMSGTPVSDGLLGLWSQLYLLDQGQRLGKKITHYRDKYFELDLQKDRTGRTYKVKQGDLIEGRDVYEAIIFDKVRDICISMDTRAYLDLPPVTQYLRYLNMEDAMGTYKKLKRDMVLLTTQGDITVANRAVLVNKLKQLASGQIYDENKNVIDVHMHKADTLFEMVEAANWEPVVIYYWYAHERKRILQVLKQLKLRIAELKKDDDLDLWNAGKLDALVLHPRSAGHGLNLQRGGHIIIWYSLPFYSAELFKQANTRVDRSGQTQGVLIYVLLMSGTVEEDELKVIEGKMTREEAFLHAVAM